MNVINSNLSKRILVILGVIISLTFLFIASRTDQVVNPNNDKELSAEEGRDYAALYRQGSIYSIVDGNEDVMSQIRKDILTFARVTRNEFRDKNILIGFTFDKKTDMDGGAHIYTGRYYGLKDRIRIKLTPEGSGVYTISIVNTSDNTNIDENLLLNGKRNRYVKVLPIEGTYYSIRYQLTMDRIVVTFYEDYTRADVEAVKKSVTEALGEVTHQDVIYTINAKGIFSIQEITAFAAP